MAGSSDKKNPDRRRRLLEEQRRVDEARRKRSRTWFIAVVAVIVVIAGVVVAVSATKKDSSSSNTAADAGATPTPSGTVVPCSPKTTTVPTVNTTAATGEAAFPAPSEAPPCTLLVKDLKKGSGTAVTSVSTPYLWNYSGASWSTGLVFDTSLAAGGQPAKFSLDQVIPGWTKGLVGMKPGGTRELVIPPGQAYGASGRPPSIAPNETLVFVVELVGPAS